MLHPEEKIPSISETVETRIKNVAEKRVQAIDAINQAT
jgi:hypothetical protein